MDWWGFRSGWPIIRGLHASREIYWPREWQECVSLEPKPPQNRMASSCGRSPLCALLLSVLWDRSLSLLLYGKCWPCLSRCLFGCRRWGSIDRPHGFPPDKVPHTIRKDLPDIFSLFSEGGRRAPGLNTGPWVDRGWIYGKVQVIVVEGENGKYLLDGGLHQ